MRRLFAICAILIVQAMAISAQSTASADPINHILVLAEKVPGSGQKASLLTITKDEFYIRGPVVSLPAKPLPGQTLKASRFSIRAWHEGDDAKVVVYAVVSDSQTPTRGLETPIATYTLKWSDDPMLIRETVVWGAMPITVRPFRPLRR